MKKFLSIISVLTLCFVLGACGNTTISGDPVSYSNADKSFSIDLPTSSEEDWVINEEAADSVLDISDAKDTINIQVQCLSKDQAEYIATDLESYRDYSLANTLGDILSSLELEDTELQLPEFVNDSICQSFTLKDGGNTVKGVVAFMESDSSYYTYMIMGVDEAYDGNEDALMESLLSLKELAAAPADGDTSAEGEDQGSGE